MFLSSRTIELVDVTESQVRIARSAYRNFGKGSRPPAGLDFGDCFAYALASSVTSRCSMKAVTSTLTSAALSHPDQRQHFDPIARLG